MTEASKFVNERERERERESFDGGCDNKRYIMAGGTDTYHHRCLLQQNI